MELEERLQSMRDTHSEAGGGASGEEERLRGLLEDRLRAAESSVEDAKQSAGEMEGVVAKLREEGVSSAVARRRSHYLLQMLPPGRSVPFMSDRTGRGLFLVSADKCWFIDPEGG